MDYKPIDWNEWKKNWQSGTGRGQNIKKFLDEKYWKIWESISFHEDVNLIERPNIPAQDSRNDSGHGEVVTYFSHILWNELGGNSDVIFPATMFHDTGYNISAEEFREAFMGNGGKTLQLKIRLEHQVRGAHFAYDYLNRINWPIKSISEIHYIIGDHDTRFFPTTHNGEIMRDADILYRFTLAHTEAYYENIKEKSSLSEKIEKELGNFNFSLSEQIARIEMENTLRNRFS